jgi:O-antigen/teichoic acid export membrane protein
VPLSSLFFALIPAIGVRIFTALILGGNQSSKIVKFIIIAATFYTIFIVTSAIFFGITGWVVVRVVVDSFILFFIISMVYGWENLNFQKIIHIFRYSGQTFLSGIGANYAFLVRVCADSLPLFCLSANINNSNELGLYGFASLINSIPAMIYGALLQSKISKMISMNADADSFNKAIIAEIKFAAKISILAIACLILFSKFILEGYFFTKYKDAHYILIILSFILPARAMSMIAGFVCVIRGWYTKSSILALTEILFFGLAFLLYCNNLSDIVWAVTISVWLSIIPAGYLIFIAKEN